MRFARYWVLAFVVSLGLLGSWSVVNAAGMPPAPILYSGDVTLAGAAPPDSVTEHPTREVAASWGGTTTVVDDHINMCVENCITAVVGDFVSVPGIITNGRYTLTLGVPDSSYTNSDIVFYYEGSVIAQESDNYRQALNSASSAAAVLRSNFTLTFPALPTPTPIPTSTPLPTATPTLTPVPTATPAIPPIMIIGGTINVVSGDPGILEGARVSARVSSYFSGSVEVTIKRDGLAVFQGLIVEPGDWKFVGKNVNFDLNGLPVTVGQAFVFSPEGGGVEVELFVEGAELAVATVVPQPAPAIVPTAVPLPTAAPPSVPFTATPAPVLPTATSVAVPQTNVQQADLQKSLAAAIAALEAKARPVAVVPTQTPVILVITPTAEPTEEIDVGEPDGGCNSVGPVSPWNGAGNTLMLFGPLLLIAGYRGWKRKK